MKKATLICLLIVLCFSCCAYAEEDEAIPLMPAGDLQEKIDNYPNYIYLLDLRSKKEYSAAHIPYACSVPLRMLCDTMQEVLYSQYIYKGIEITVYANTDEEETEGVRILRDLGFTNVYRLGTLDAWAGRLVSVEDDRRILGYMRTVDLYGQSVDQTLLAGHKVTMVNIWATYWTPSGKELATLAKLYEEYGGADFQVITLVSDVLDATLTVVDDKVLLARQIASDAGADYPHLVPSRELFFNIIGQLNAIPTTFFVDETGMMIGQLIVGSRTLEEWESIVEDMISLAEK